MSAPAWTPGLAPTADYFAKDATIAVTLKADSGYHGELTTRANVLQWATISRMLEGDGRLENAAPDLAEAAAAALGLLTGNMDGDLPSDGRDPVDMLRAALAKATGQ